MTKTRPLPWISTAIFAALFLVILVMAYTGNLPVQLAAIPHYDKPGHLILYAVAAYLGHRILQRRRIRVGGMRLPFWILIFGTFTVIEEVLQGLSPNRSLDALDLIFSGLGIALGYGLAERENS